MISYNFIPVGAVIQGKENNVLTVLENRRETLLIQCGDKTGVVDIGKVTHWTYCGFSIGDRVTLTDKYQVRAADVGTIEAITKQGIQIIWDAEPQPPIQWRTFTPVEIELVDQYQDRS